MVRMAVLGLSLIVVGVDVGRAQDIAGIEDCTKTGGLDKRTGCLQSNVNFLQRQSEIIRELSHPLDSDPQLEEKIKQLVQTAIRKAA